MKAGERKWLSLMRQQCDMRMWPLAVPRATGSPRDSACLLTGLGRGSAHDLARQCLSGLRPKGQALMVRIVGLGWRRQL